MERVFSLRFSLKWWINHQILISDGKLLLSVFVAGLLGLSMKAPGSFQDPAPG